MKPERTCQSSDAIVFKQMFKRLNSCCLIALEKLSHGIRSEKIGMQCKLCGMEIAEGSEEICTECREKLSDIRVRETNSRVASLLMRFGPREAQATEPPADCPTSCSGGTCPSNPERPKS